MTHFLSSNRARASLQLPGLLRNRRLKPPPGRSSGGGRQSCSTSRWTLPSALALPLPLSLSFSSLHLQHTRTSTRTIIMSQQQDYKFEGWAALGKDSVEGKMAWQDYEPKAFADDDIDMKIMYCVRSLSLSRGGGRRREPALELPTDSRPLPSSSRLVTGRLRVRPAHDLGRLGRRPLPGRDRPRDPRRGRARRQQGQQLQGRRHRWRRVRLLSLSLDEADGSQDAVGGTASRKENLS